jgi:hypothetical protein
MTASTRSGGDGADRAQLVDGGQVDDALADQLLRALGELEDLHACGHALLGPSERLRGAAGSMTSRAGLLARRLRAMSKAGSYFLRITVDSGREPGVTPYPSRGAAEEAFRRALRPQPWTGPGRAPEGEAFTAELLAPGGEVIDVGHLPGPRR